MSSETAIAVEGVWKRYGFPPLELMRRGWSRLGRGPSTPPRWALQDVNLEVSRGETIGLIGRNGAGKSTLLKVLAGVTPATRGRAVARGRLFPMIELNAGLHQELTGRENIRMLGAVMGLSRREMARRMGDIVEFTELSDALDRPVRTYSTGMLARIGFAVAMHVDAEIILIDEVLSVGDYAFQKKCVDRMRQVIHGGATIVFVSHNPYMIERMCDRAVLMQQGQAEELGQVGDVIHRYFSLGSEAAAKGDGTSVLANDVNRPGSGDLRFTAIDFIDGSGQSTNCLHTGQEVTVRLHYRAARPVHEPNLSFAFHDSLNTVVSCCTMTEARQGFVAEGEGVVECCLPVLGLMPGPYSVRLRAAGEVLYDVVESAAQVMVEGTGSSAMHSGGLGISYQPGNWRVESVIGA